MANGTEDGRLRKPPPIVSPTGLFSVEALTGGGRPTGVGALLAGGQSQKPEDVLEKAQQALSGEINRVLAEIEVASQPVGDQQGRQGLLERNRELSAARRLGIVLGRKERIGDKLRERVLIQKRQELGNLVDTFLKLPQVEFRQKVMNQVLENAQAFQLETQRREGAAELMQTYPNLNPAALDMWAITGSKEALNEAIPEPIDPNAQQAAEVARIDSITQMAARLPAESFAAIAQTLGPEAVAMVPGLREAEIADEKAGKGKQPLRLVSASGYAVKETPGSNKTIRQEATESFFNDWLAEWRRLVGPVSRTTETIFGETTTEREPDFFNMEVPGDPEESARRKRLSIQSAVDTFLNRYNGGSLGPVLLPMIIPREVREAIQRALDAQQAAVVDPVAAAQADAAQAIIDEIKRRGQNAGTEAP